MIVVLLTFALLSAGNAMQCPNVRNDPMPTLDPTQFSYKIQITVEDLQQTLDGYEFYDKENQTIVLCVDQTVGSDHAHDQKKVVYDFKYNQTFVVERNNGTNETCTVEDLDPSMPHEASLFGVGVENGPLGVKNAFYWNGTYNATFLGNDTVVDGIPTDHFQTCLNFDDGKWTYMVDIYFSSANWTMPAGQQAPVLLTLNATDEKNMSHYYTYKFSDYHTSALPRVWTPSKPHDIICEGRNDAPDFPPFSNQFSMEMEMHLRINASNILSSISEWYDYDNNLFRLDAHTLKGTYSQIHDFNQGLSYNITQRNCSITPISAYSPSLDAELAPNNSALVRLRRPSDFKRLFNLTFGGFRQYSGIPAAVWMGQSPLEARDNIYHGEKALIYETYYTSTEKWNGFHQILGIKQKHISVMYGINITTIIEGETFNFKNSVSMSSFDISPCFDSTMRKKVVFKFSSDYQSDVDANPLGFSNAFIATVVKHANVSQLRVKLESVSAYQNEQDENGGGIYVWVTILDMPNVTGDSVDMKPESNLTVALVALEAVVRNNEFEVVFAVSPTKQQTMTAFQEFFKTEEELLLPPTPAPAPLPARKGVATSVVVGVSIAMVVVGVILGYLARGCRAKRSGVEYAGLL